MRRGTAELPQQKVRRVLLCPSMLAVSERARTKELTAPVACGQRCVHAARAAFTGSEPFPFPAASCPPGSKTTSPTTLPRAGRVEAVDWATASLPPAPPVHPRGRARAGQRTRP